MQTSYFHKQFPPGVKKLQLHINALELLTIVVALKAFGKLLKGKKALIFSDNMSPFDLINRVQLGMNFIRPVSEKYVITWLLLTNFV